MLVVGARAPLAHRGAGAANHVRESNLAGDEVEVQAGDETEAQALYGVSLPARWG